jgi:hypothetical protein
LINESKVFMGVRFINPRIRISAVDILFNIFKAIDYMKLLNSPC